MTSPSVTYSLNNGDTSDASQVNQNFSDIINALTDATKSISVDAITAAGAVALNGTVGLGNASGDAITVNGTMEMKTALKVDSIVPATTNNGTAIQGKKDGTAVAAGNVGEALGTTTAYTGASTIKDISSTNWAAGGGAQIWSRNFNKGIYLVVAWSKADLGGTAGGYMYFRVNGAQASDFSRTSGVTGWQTLPLMGVFSVDTDSTPIDITAVCGTSSGSASTEVTIARIG